MAPSQQANPRRHIVIVGGGAAGMSCAATLANHPDEFKVTLLEKNSIVGGQAMSIPLDQEKYGASWMNNGVQGGSQIFKHTFHYFNQHNSPAQPLQLQVSFGKGPSGFWTNCFPSKLVAQHASDIRRFGLFLKVVKWTMPVLGALPISLLLRLFFSRGFADKMVYPLIALFLGTGNQTAHVPAAIVERLFDDPNMKLWDYDPDTLLPNQPTMYSFDCLDSFYGRWKDDLVAKGVTIRTDTEVVEVASRSKRGVDLVIKNNGNDGTTTTNEHFDHLVLCVLADDALRILGKSATWREKLVLGGARFYDDLTVTHSDSEYFNKHYETRFKPELCGEPKSEAQCHQIASAKGEPASSSSSSSPSSDQQQQQQPFNPMYYTYTYQEDPRLIEMSFNCSNYQHQFKRKDASSSSSPSSSPSPLPVYQTIFLDKRKRDLWTEGEIDESKVIQRNWWHQLGHRWQHYVRVVPGVMFLQGRNNTLFAGSWTLVNMHEVACISGIAAAYRLGAEYRKFDDFAQDFFVKYLLVSHGKLFSREEKKREKAKAKAT
ncbi:FAD/NAD(P)-binding domain-containing protein [Trichoderma citrinoviride]|uniref:FAD/NAD(P)-binding domain-containing protein n=1 Tax=Trichoderma citrinoviride TaxID=58853 RepID=A0A2T4BBL7_9HYPO|nr:FAD/NAD(P)-binding domain-containing protein [Trichoderma citrinoviride]PTB66589.1 FAD/NAD(P)-binding domain-containing protein [Trichoderma citrinoviride]